ncbi:putative RNA polymerase II transcription elongation factor [Rhizodiscina lignyota]|uniref:RNA polymerase II transcription elongation factor n=1 Tax=Rhizodiscina lignyota TaxID=1504668 RepID=A0A9P4M1T3_9PEZI|nr:putative RNA polymerase II transcription elongation factor [Rhizodiscina lignyota]
MATLTNGHNGVNGSRHQYQPGAERFSDIPPAIDITVNEEGDEEAVEVNLVELLDDPTELCTLLENENVPKTYWMVIALAYAKQRKVDHAIEILTKGMGALRRDKPDEKLSMLCGLVWMYLWKCREAPRVKPDGVVASEARTKDFYIQQATSALNEAARLSPSYAPLFLARGVLHLLKASLQGPPKATPGGQDNSERMEALRSALKCFEDSLRHSPGTNLMAVMGKARVYFALGKYADALQGYQTVLERAPELVDPDPRIGIGACLWQLGHKEEAKNAWDRALEVSPDSTIANMLLGIYYLDSSSKYPISDPKFADLYKKAMMSYTHKAFKLDDHLPIACATFGGYFLVRKYMPQVESLAKRAIELTDVNAIASDGWYLLARKEHYEGDPSKAHEYYLKADQARGGDERGYLPAKFGAAQIRVLMEDFDGAKFRLEKIVQQSKSIEAMTLLGTLYAEDVFTAQSSAAKEDRSAEKKKAIGLLESVRMAWKDPKKKLSPDSAVLLNLSRLYETDQPEKSLQCLQQVEQMELDAIPEDDRPEDIEDEVEMKAALREQLPPELLNNMACFHYQAEKYPEARELFQSALNACVKAGDKDQSLDTDALVTTISYNLARTYEAEGLLDEAKQVYEGLVARHEDYTDANTRLAYINLRQNPTEEGPKAVQELYQAASNDLEVRALYGWYLSKSKRRTGNIAEDAEQRHYKHSLQQYDKHDRYSLTGMGNLYLTVAREMRRETDQDRQKRSKMYERAVEFFDKALQLDARNAYAAQGIGIAMIEDKKDFPGAVQVFTKVKETLRDSTVCINLGHAYCELKQYTRAIENYDVALAKDRANDPQLLACLGRVWYLRGKQERNIQAMRTSLEFSQRALEVAPDQIHFRFNVAFVQFQISQTMVNIPESQRTVEDVQAALDGLTASIDSLIAIAKSPNPPFPRGDIEQRANMGRNTIRRQLERALQAQKEYEEKNASRLEQARQLREAEIRKREEEKKRLEEEAEEARKKILEERTRMQERDRELAEQRADEEKARVDAEMTTDSETGERRKRTKKKAAKRKKKGEETGDEDDGVEGEEGRRRGTPGTGDEDGERRKKKRRRLERKSEKASKKSSKYKSADFIEDSDEEDDALQEMDNNAKLAEKLNDDESMPDTPMPDEDGEDEELDAAPKARKSARVIDDEDEDEEDERPANGTPPENGVTSEADDVDMFGDGEVDGGNAAATDEDE